MKSLRFLVLLFGHFLMSFALVLGIVALFLFLFVVQEEQIGELVDETFTRVFEEHPEVLFSLVGDARVGEFQEQCEAEGLPPEACSLDAENPMIAAHLGEIKDQLKENVGSFSVSFAPYKQWLYWGFFLAVFLFLLGAFFVLFSFAYAWLPFFRNMAAQFGFVFLGSFGVVFFLLQLRESDLQGLLQAFFLEIPRDFLQFGALFLYTLIHVLFEPYLYLLLFLAVFFLVLWIVLWVVLVTRRRKKKIRST